MMKQLFVFLLLFILSPGLAQTNFARQKAEANQAFEKGLFKSADEKITTLLNSNPDDKTLQYRLAELSLLNNRFSQAESLLSSILKESPEDSLASKLLAETLYRQDKYERLPALYKASGKQSKIRQIEHFTSSQRQPYLIEKDFKKITVKMQTVDFLPSVLMKVNGKEALFIIDTGGGETIIDSEFAKEVNALAFEQQEAIYAGGAKAKTTFGFVDELEIGKLKVKNIPIHIQSTKQFSQAVGGRVVSGIIGTNLMYHFISTLDYQSGELVLYKKGSDLKKRKAVQIPFWLASDHLILALGNIKNGEDQIFLVDTGMAGAGFTSPKSTLENANIKLPGTGSFEGEGAGGKVSVTPFMIDKISLGKLSNASQIVGLYGAFPPTLENQLGFRIGGLISHTFFRPYKISFDFEKMIIYAEQ